jgi:hypothetical protein
MGKAVVRSTAARSARPTCGVPPVSMTATQRVPTTKPRLATSPPCSGVQSSTAPMCTNTPAFTSVTLSGAAAAKACTAEAVPSASKVGADQRRGASGPRGMLPYLLSV